MTACDWALWCAEIVLTRHSTGRDPQGARSTAEEGLTVAAPRMQSVNAHQNKTRRAKIGPQQQITVRRQHGRAHKRSVRKLRAREKPTQMGSRKKGG